jgi:hypothetical protein
MKHAKLFKSAGTAKTGDGRVVEILEFQCGAARALIPTWAAHLRSHYCSEEEVAKGIKGTGLSKKEFLKRHKIPSKGPVVSAEFAEILVADYIEFCLGYQVPRVRYLDKIRPDALVPGTDVVGFKRGERPPLDELISCEIKSALVCKSDKTLHSAMKDAGAKDTGVDPLRMADTLVATKSRLSKLGLDEVAAQVERYQNKYERPYIHVVAAAAVHCDSTWHQDVLAKARYDGTPDVAFKLFLVKGPSLMALARDLYEAACA